MVEKRNLPPTTLVIFGISGDLAGRYILPALSALKAPRQLPKDFKILGLSRRQITEADVLADDTLKLKEHLSLRQMDMDDHLAYEELYKYLGNRGELVFYFSVPPPALLPILVRLGKAGFNKRNIKLLLEKPFGTDLGSAKDLIGQINKHFSEEQVYRIDHYLAKGMAQNIAVFLSSNALIRDVWNHKFIDYIEIVVAERIGIEGRADFYEQTGALRDIVQSHLLQLAALVLMEPCPDPFDFAELPKRRAKALAQLEAVGSSFRGQYQGYKEEASNPDSQVENFAAIELASNSSNWQDVQIYLATGKNLDQRLTQIRVNFKKSKESEANQLVIRIQPKEGIELDMWARSPGYDDKLEKRTLSFSYEQDFDGRLPDAYEQVLLDAMSSKSGLFASSDEVLETWRILQPIIESWQSGKVPLKTYRPGSSVEQVLAKDI